MKQSSPISQSDSVFFYGLFIVCFCLHLFFSLQGWSQNILGIHEFRQTQTAITTYHLLQDGFKLAYLTPVLGKPWIIPMEFPIYQGLVALIAKSGQFPIDQTGRFVSLTFFYLSLIPIYSITKLFSNDRAQRFFLLCFVLASPIYLFWSRSFMIESCAFFFSLWYLSQALRSFPHTAGARECLLGAIAGLLAGITKVTTFGPYLMIGLLYYAFLFLNSLKNIPFKKVFLLYLRVGIAFFAIPGFSAIAWVHHADKLKAVGSLSHFLISANMKEWNFGTVSQKLLPETWLTFYGWMLNLLGLDAFNTVHLGVGLFLLALLLLRITDKKNFFCLALFLIGPLIFTNLYKVHDYYWYANAAAILIAIGYSLLSLAQKSSVLKIASRVFSLLLLVLMFQGFTKGYFQDQTASHAYLDALIQHIKTHTPKDSSLLIYGDDWNSRIPYYSERKALMHPRYLPVDHPKFSEALAAFSKGEFGALIITKDGTFDKIDSQSQDSLQQYYYDYQGRHKKALWQPAPTGAPLRFLELKGDLFDKIRESIQRFGFDPKPCYEDMSFIVFKNQNSSKE